MTIITRRAALATGLAALVPTVALARARIGQPAPAFTLTTFDRRKIKSADLAGEVIVLNYWAVWCGPCKAELPDIDAYVRKHASNPPRIFAVTADDTVTDNELKPLAKVLSFPLVTRIDGGGYGTIDGAVPSSYVIDRHGILRYARAAAFTYGSFDRLVTPLLDQPHPSNLANGAVEG